ncbi:MAG: hypothetical protein WBH85_15875 [Thermoanaerobaculia bacterium]
MSTKDQSESLVEEVLAGRNRELQILAAQGLAPLPPEILISLQIKLALSADMELATLANASLGELAPTLVAQVLEEHGDDGDLIYFAQTSDHPLVLETVIRHRQSSAETLKVIAKRASPDLQEILLLRQDIIIEDPGVLEELEQNPELSSYSSRRIGEYREHLLFRKKIIEEFPIEEDVEEVTNEEVIEAIDRVRREVAPAGDKEDLTGLTEVQIRALPVKVRMKLARHAGRTMRNLLVRDKNPLVARTVMTESMLTDGELELIAGSRAVVDDVFQIIARNERWLQKYPVMAAMAKNPRVNIGVAVRLIPRLSVRDLRALRRDYNVSQQVRQTADRLYKVKRV